jgi:hypothetical protein
VSHRHTEKTLGPLNGDLSFTSGKAPLTIYVMQHLLIQGLKLPTHSSGPVPITGDLTRIPTDLVSIAEGAACARIARETISRWIGRGLISVWGRKGCFRVSLAEILPQTVTASHTESDPSKPGPGSRKLVSAEPRKPHSSNR